MSNESSFPRSPRPQYDLVENLELPPSTSNHNVVPRWNGYQPDANYAGVYRGPNHTDYGHGVQYRDNPWYEAMKARHLRLQTGRDNALVKPAQIPVIPLSERPNTCLSLLPTLWRVQHTSGPRTFSLGVRYPHTLHMVCPTMPTPRAWQAMPNDGIRDRPQLMPDVADAFSSSVPESAPSETSAMESLKRLSDRYLHHPGSPVCALRMRLSPSGGRLRVMITLDIDV